MWRRQSSLITRCWSGERYPRNTYLYNLSRSESSCTGRSMQSIRLYNWWRSRISSAGGASRACSNPCNLQVRWSNLAETARRAVATVDSLAYRGAPSKLRLLLGLQSALSLWFLSLPFRLLAFLCQHLFHRQSISLRETFLIRLMSPTYPILIYSLFSPKSFHFTGWRIIYSVPFYWNLFHCFYAFVWSFQSLHEWDY